MWRRELRWNQGCFASGGSFCLFASDTFNPIYLWQWWNWPQWLRFNSPFMLVLHSFSFNHRDIASSLLLNNRTSVRAQNPPSLPAITKAHSLTNIGNSRLIAPPTPSIYLLLTRLPPLLYVWFPHCIYKNDFPHWPLTLVFFLAPSSRRLRDKINKFRQTQQSFSLL